jgi:DNA-binding transcriptional regulator YiaG
METSALQAQIRSARSLPTPAACRAIREAARVSQADLARALGVARETVYRWEAGTCAPRGRRLQDYVVVLELMQREIGSRADS